MSTVDHGVRLTKAPATHALRAVASEHFGVGGRRIRWRRFALTLAVVALHLPLGFIRAAWELWRWVNVGEAAHIRRATLDAPVTGGEDATGRGAAYAQQKASQAKIRAERVTGLKVAAVAVAVGVLILWATSPRALFVLTVAFVVWLAWFGWTWRHAPRDLIDTAVVVAPSEAPRVTYDALTEAFDALGIASLSKAIKDRGPEAIRWVSHIARDARDIGTVVGCELPGAVTAQHIIRRHDEFAGALGRSRTTVHLSGDPDRSTSYLEVWLPDRDLARTKRDPSPLLVPEYVGDYFAPFQIGVDTKLRPVTLCLDERNALLGGEPGSGKTGGMAAILFGAGLDPLLRAWVFELKGTGDLEDAALFAERYAHGQRREVIEAAFEALRDLRRDGQERSDKFNDVPRELRPDFKVTREIADRYPRDFFPRLLMIDEAHVLLNDRNLGEEAGRELVEITRLARYSATSVVLSTQKPGKNTIPTDLRGNLHIRIAFKVDDEYTNKQILGGNAADRGLCAHKLEEGQPGIAWVIGAPSHRGPVQSGFDYLPGGDRRVLGERCHMLRVTRGLLVGHAAGEEIVTPDLPEHDFLRDVVQATASHPRPFMWTTNLLAELAERWPHKYTDWTPDTLAAAFRPYGIGPEPAHDRPRGNESAKGTTMRGYRLEPVRRALRERDCQTPARSSA